MTSKSQIKSHRCHKIGMTAHFCAQKYGIFFLLPLLTFHLPLHCTGTAVPKFLLQSFLYNLIHLTFCPLRDLSPAGSPLSKQFSAASVTPQTSIFPPAHSLAIDQIYLSLTPATPPAQTFPNANSTQKTE